MYDRGFRAVVVGLAAAGLACAPAAPQPPAAVVSIGAATGAPATTADAPAEKSKPCKVGKDAGCLASIVPECSLSHVGTCPELPPGTAHDEEEADLAREMLAKCRGGSGDDCVRLAHLLRGSSQLECAVDMAEEGCKGGAADACLLAADLVEVDAGPLDKACGVAFRARTCDLNPKEGSCVELVSNRMKPGTGDWWTAERLIADLCEAENGPACMEVAGGVTDQDSDRYFELVHTACLNGSDDGCTALSDRDLRLCQANKETACMFAVMDAYRYLTRLDVNDEYHPDVPRAEALAEAACKMENLMGCGLLVDLYHDGARVGPYTGDQWIARDAVKAREQALRLAGICERGRYDPTDVTHCFSIATKLEKGSAVKKDAARAAKIRKVACALSNAKPCPPQKR